MKMSSFALKSALVVLYLASAFSAVAQSDYLTSPGLPTFGTQIPAGPGLINISNGNLHIDIPLPASKQRGDLSVAGHLIYDSRVFQITDVNGDLVWQPNAVKNTLNPQLAASGWRVQFGDLANSFGATQFIESPCTTSYGDFNFTDSDGTIHKFDMSTRYWAPDSFCNSGQTSVSTAQGHATDGSGYTAYVTDFYHMNVFDPHGNELLFPDNAGNAGLPVMVDRNGNVSSFDSNYNFVDSLGRTPVIKTVNGNTTTYSVLVPGGQRANYVVTFTDVNWATFFGQSGVNEAYGTFPAVQSIQFPDGSTYSFTYDSGTTLGHYGQLLSMTLPQGGTVQYGYTPYTDSYQNRNLWLTSSTLDGQTTTYTPSVISVCAAQTQVGCQEKVTMHRPSGDETVFTVTLDHGAWNTKTEYYQGAASGGNILMTVDRQHSYTSAGDPLCNTICPFLSWDTGLTTTTTMDITGIKAVTVTSSTIPWSGITSQEASHRHQRVKRPTSTPMGHMALISHRRSLPKMAMELQLHSSRLVMMNSLWQPPPAYRNTSMSLVRAETLPM